MLYAQVIKGHDFKAYILNRPNDISGHSRVYFAMMPMIISPIPNALLG